ncbi:rod shape-determining protein MreD [Nocardioides insulae]|uniref:rod shape-determining protein MreD n=1 Tax=Nocardioides insulae TaxID=394734 RepID=UPI0004293AA0|nr:rod shape-determining protein MreD [Nocardioides insulae]
MTLVRGVLIAVVISLAVVLQTSVLSGFAWRGVVPDLALLVVIALALTLGGRVALPVAFATGLLLDLVPPADHAAGRWALALVLAAYVAARFRPEDRTGPSATATVATVAACSFLATSVFALSGLILGDPMVPVSDLLWVIAVAVAIDVLITPLVMPPLLWWLRRFSHDPQPDLSPMRG